MDIAGREIRIRSSMTHEEIAQMIGSSRETVTRLLSELKKKELIRLEGSTLVIRNRTALEGAGCVAVGGSPKGGRDLPAGRLPLPRGFQAAGVGCVCGRGRLAREPVARKG